MNRQAYFHARYLLRRDALAARWKASREERRLLRALQERLCHAANHRRRARRGLCDRCERRAEAEYRRVTRRRELHLIRRVMEHSA